MEQPAPIGGGATSLSIATFLRDSAGRLPPGGARFRGCNPPFDRSARSTTLRWPFPSSHARLTPSLSMRTRLSRRRCMRRHQRWTSAGLSPRFWLSSVPNSAELVCNVWENHPK